MPEKTEMYYEAQLQPLDIQAAKDMITVPDMVRAAMNGNNIEAVERLLQIQIQWEANEAKKAFFAAKSRLEFPAIQKTSKGLNSFYPPWEEIQKIIDPILRSEGFALSFTSGQPDEHDRIPVICTLSHKMGHSAESIIFQPIGSVSKAMNPNQAMGAAVSYGQRYSAKMALNLRFVGMNDDDDAQTFSELTRGERDTIAELIARAKMSAVAISGFLEYMKVKALSDINRSNYDSAVRALQAKIRKNEREAKNGIKDEEEPSH
jgi:hypothetical protein